MIQLKSPAEIAKMREAGLVVAEGLARMKAAVAPGVSTADLNAVAAGVLKEAGAIGSFLNYHGFPAVACISPNEVIVHGIPGPRVLLEGDIVSIDCGAIIEGWHADAAITVPVGEVDAESQRLMDVTREALESAIAATVASTPWRAELSATRLSSLSSRSPAAVTGPRPGPARPPAPPRRSRTAPRTGRRTCRAPWRSTRTRR